MTHCTEEGGADYLPPEEEDGGDVEASKLVSNETKRGGSSHLIPLSGGKQGALLWHWGLRTVEQVHLEPQRGAAWGPGCVDVTAGVGPGQGRAGSLCPA